MNARPRPMPCQSRWFAATIIFRSTSLRSVGGLLAVLLGVLTAPAHAVLRTWSPNVSTNWHFSGNWSPVGSPVAGDDVSISFVNSGRTTLNGDTAAVNTLSVFGGASLETSGHLLFVNNGVLNAETDINQAGSRILVTPRTLGSRAFDTDILDIGSGATLDMAGGIAEIDVDLDIFAGGTIAGDGTVNIFSNNANKLVNNGTIRAEGGTLTIRSLFGGTFDLDGSGVLGSLTSLLEAVDGSATLVIDGDSSGETFSSTVNIGGGNTIQFDQVWETDIFSTINFNTAAGTGTIVGAQLTHRGKTNVNSGTGRFAAPVVFGSASTVNVAAGATLDFSQSVSHNGTLDLAGGSVTGATITNNGVIRGFGSIATTGIDNIGAIRATGDGLLVIDTLNNPDLDGSALVDGVIEAVEGDLRVADAPADAFNGTATIGAGRFISFDSGWVLNDANAVGSVGMLNLNGGAAPASAATINGSLQVLEGIVNVDQHAQFNAPTTFVNNIFSAVIVNLNDADDVLRLGNDATVEAGATFAGNGRLINLDGATLTTEDDATIGVLLENQGTLAIGASPGDLEVEGFVQTAAGILEIELANITLGNFDVLTVQANAILAGTLDVSLINPFEPVLGNSFTIIETIVGNVSGEFDVENLPIFNGLTFDVLYNSQSVVLEVIESADRDGDGDVDGADFLLIQRTDPSLIPLWESEFGSGVGPLASSQAIPEPTTMSLLLAALLLCRWQHSTNSVIN